MEPVKVLPTDARVPGFVIRDKAVDYDREILAIMGEGYRVGSWHFRPPSLGVWSLWEIIDSPIIKGDPDACLGDFWRLLWINDLRQSAVRYVADWVAGGKPALPKAEGMAGWKKACEMDRAVIRYAMDSIPAGVLSLDGMAAIRGQVELCYSGYEMLPGGGGCNRKYLFAGEAYGAVCSHSVAAHEELIWNTPMCLLGHVAAHNAVVNGVKGVGRPKDREDTKLQIRLANEAEARGELHQWQRDYPDTFPPSPTQCKFPGLLAEFEAILKAKGKKAHG